MPRSYHGPGSALEKTSTRMTTTASPADSRVALTLADRIAPSIPAVVFVVLAVFGPLVAQRRMLNGDGDLARHLRHGLYMLQHGTIIWHDPFSFTRPGQPFVPFEYGSQLLYTLAYRLGGLAGVTVFAGCLIGAVYALLARLLLRRRVDPLLVVLTIGAAAFLGFPHWAARPHLISWVAIVVCFGLVEYDRQPSMWLFPVLFAVWANLHGGWLYGIALMGIYLVGHVVEYLAFDRTAEEAKAVRYFAAIIPLSAVATLATPMGLRLWKHLYEHLGDTYVIDHTKEFASPNFHPFAAKLLLAVIIVALGALLVSRRRAHSARLLLVLAGVWWALVSVRNIPLFGLTGLSVIALHLDPEWRMLPGSWLARRREAFAAGALKGSTSGWILAGISFLAIVAIGHGRAFGHELLADNFDDRAFPVVAVERARAAHLNGRIFADFAWGGYILFAWPEQRVFIDGGTDFYGASIMQDYNAVDGLQPGWRDILDRYRVEAVLAKAHSKLARELVRSPGWSLWYCDSVAAILRRDSSVTARDPAGREAALVSCAKTDAVHAGGAQFKNLVLRLPPSRPSDPITNAGAGL